MKKIPVQCENQLQNVSLRNPCAIQELIYSITKRDTSNTNAMNLLQF